MEYTPTEADNARWREEMRDWRKIVRVNKTYYDEIDAAMAALPQPTIGQAINAMSKKGNRPFFEQFTYLDPAKIEKEFRFVAPPHEIAHIAGRFGQTPEQEQWLLPFETGFRYGLVSRNFAQKEIDEFKTHLAKETENYKNSAGYFYKNKEDVQDAVASPRTTAINLAAGMYLREKMEQFYQQKLRDMSYETQQAFAVGYSETDHAPIPDPHISGENAHHSFHALQLIRNDSPYALIQLTPKEWRAITGIATGLLEPNETPYPQRLEPIRQALQHLGVAVDKKQAFAKALQAQASIAGKTAAER